MSHLGRIMLTIVSITKNDLDGISRTISSTKKLRTDYGVSHFIIDSSDSGVRSKLREQVGKQVGCKYFFLNKNGVSNAFNHGLHQVENGWVWFLNGGDCVNAKVDLITIINVIKHTQADAVIFQIKTAQSNEVVKHPPLWDIWPPSVNWIPHPATIVRKKVFDEFGSFRNDFNIAMDGEFWLRAFSKQAVVDLISIPLTIYDQTGISSLQIDKTRTEQNKATMMHLVRLLRIWIYSGAKIFYQNKWLHLIKNQLPSSREQ